jgi:hypothetical protein
MAIPRCTRHGCGAAVLPLVLMNGADTVGRIVTNGLAQVTGQTVVVENRAGAAGNIAAEVAAAPIADSKDPAEDPHMIARGALTEIDDPELGKLKMPTVQPRLSETPGRIEYAGLPMGVHNREIYIERPGMEEGELERLRAAGVVGTSSGRFRIQAAVSTARRTGIGKSTARNSFSGYR